MMYKLYFFTEARLIKNQDGEYFGDSGFASNVLNRYLSVFNKIIVVARVKNTDNINTNKTGKINSNEIEVFDLPNYIGPLGYLKVRSELIKRLNSVLSLSLLDQASYICRLPGNIGNITINWLRKNNLKYGVEVVGDPWDVFAPTGVSHPLRVVFRYLQTYKLKENVRHAKSVLYVTSQTLQKRYPSNPGAFTTNASNVSLLRELVKTPKKHQNKKVFKIISVGSLSQMYKAPDIVLKALKICKEKEVDFSFIWLGEGVYKSNMITLSEELKLNDCISFKGNVSAEEVYDYVLDSHLFIMASRTEGLPRALVEAMALGLPCIGTNVGGIPELLSKEALVEKDDAEALASKIKLFLESPEIYNNQAKSNLKTAKSYLPEVLQKRREEFYNSLITLNN